MEGKTIAWITVISFLGLIIFMTATAIDSDTLNDLCDTENSFMYRFTNGWGCRVIENLDEVLEGNFDSVNVTGNVSIGGNLFVYDSIWLQNSVFSLIDNVTIINTTTYINTDTINATNGYFSNSVGVGLSNPSAKLHIKDGDLYITNSTGLIYLGHGIRTANRAEGVFHAIGDNVAELFFGINARTDINEKWTISSRTSAEGNDLIFYKAPNITGTGVFMPILTLDGGATNDYVGINTATPSNSLQVKVDNTNDGIAIQGVEGDRKQLILMNGSTQVWRTGITSTTARDYAFFDGTQNMMVLGFNGNVSIGKPSAVVSTFSKMGIGTTNPTAYLEVANNQNVDIIGAVLNTTPTVGIFIQTGRIDARRATTSTVDFNITTSLTSGTWGVDGGDIHFMPNQTLALTIKPNKNIIIQNLTGTGNDYVCVDANGILYRSDGVCI